MTNNTSADVTFGGAWCNRVAANQEEDSHSIATADKHINYFNGKNNISIFAFVVYYNALHFFRV